MKTISLLLAIPQIHSQSIQGYVYWDQNSNGIVDGATAFNARGNELVNGVIDVDVEVRSCGGDEDSEFSVLQ
jgi:hypothetical protein